MKLSRRSLVVSAVGTVAVLGGFGCFQYALRHRVNSQNVTLPTPPTIQQWAALPETAPITYQVSEIRLGDVVPNDAQDVEVESINNHGQIVGSFKQRKSRLPFGLGTTSAPRFAPNLIEHSLFASSSFLWDNGKTTLLPDLDSLFGVSATAINDKGRIVGDAMLEVRGQSQGGGLVNHAVLWENSEKTPRDLGAQFGTADSHATNVNASGQVCLVASGALRSSGSSMHTIYVNETYLWDGSLRSMGRDTAAHKINGAGEAVAVLGESPKQTIAFLAPGKAPVALNDLMRHTGRTGLQATLTDQNQVVGMDAKGLFRYQNGTFTHQDIAHSSYIGGANHHGDVIGSGSADTSLLDAQLKEQNLPRSVTNMSQQPFLWRKNRLIYLNAAQGSAPHWVIWNIRDINDQGQIIGEGCPLSIRGQARPDGALGLRPILLTPILPPFPSTSPKL